MKGVQPPVEPPPAGCFAFFSSSSKKNFDYNFFSKVFSSFKRPKNSKNINELFGCLREGKNPGKKIKSKFLQDDEEKKQNCPPTKDQPEAELPP